MYVYMYIYIYIHVDRERERYAYIYARSGEVDLPPPCRTSRLSSEALPPSVGERGSCCYYYY